LGKENREKTPYSSNSMPFREEKSSTGSGT
jgi:hypothetical protein